MTTTALQVQHTLNTLRTMPMTLMDNSCDIIEGSGVISTGQAQSLLGATVTLPADSIPYGFCHCGCGQKTKIAPRTHAAFGYIKGHPVRFVVGHNIRISRPHRPKTWKSATGTPTHISWGAMLRRTRPDSEHAKYYHHRGILVCDRWKNFDLFVEDMGERPDGTTLDRIDNNRGYEPGNCRWATQAVQITNTSTNRYLECNGERLTITEWGRRSGVGHSRIHARLASGWPVELAVTLPARHGRKVMPHV